MKSRTRRILTMTLILVAILLIAGLSYQALSAAADRRNYPPTGALIDMGGYHLHLHCEGEGAPTVLLIAGAGDIAAIWETVQNKLRADTRVCSYDRPGLGWSDYSSDTDLTIQLQMQILYDLLENAGEAGPYIVVGHSIGGVMARTFAAQNPAETVGLVLVDSSVESQFSIFPVEIVESNQAADTVFSACKIVAPFGLVRLLGLGTARAASFDLLSAEAQAAIANTFHQTRGCAALQRDGAVSDEPLLTGEPFEPLGDVPLVVLTAGLTEYEERPESAFSAEKIALFDEKQAVWFVLQEGLTYLSTDSTWVIAERSGHYIHTTEPELVIEAVRTLLAAE